MYVWTGSGVSVSRLAPGRNKRISASVPITLPPLIEDGTYILVAYIDSSDAVAELDEDNNTVVTTTAEWAITISEGYPLILPDLTGEFGRISFRGSTRPGAIGRAEINVSNVGILVTESKQVIDIEVNLRSCDVPGPDITLLTLRDQSVSNLEPGKSKTFRTTFELPAGLGEGEYQLVARVDISEDVTELDETNNEALSTCFQIMGE